MCELMGFHFHQPLAADFSLHAFGGRSEENADGWGLAWYPDESLALLKEPRKWRGSPHTSFLESYAEIRSSICIAHVRRRTTGRLTHADTHPFGRELDGVDYCFAHNGTVPAAFSLPLGRFRPIGQTDSEYVFCYLLDAVASWEGRLADEMGWRQLEGIVTRLNACNRLNFLLSDGHRLFAYHDQGGWKGLYCRKVRIKEQGGRHFEDADLQVDLDSSASNFGIVVATSPLSSTGWEPLQPGELAVFADGQLRWSNRPRLASGQGAG